ncbi:tRNA (guanosine(46)-N7)-methyltransferase TrmB [Mycoplasmatota bacterium]|nr:tRNA (guanosine(46)-N7)-methyltransferase TrmB [Mycoplasmatota bacterium]
MRLRKIANAEEILKNNPDYVKLEPQEYKGKWNRFFKNENPIHIEVGMGKGQFIIGMAKNNPDINYIGIEVVQSVMVRAVEKLKEEPLPNVILVCFDASALNEVFETNEVDRIYLNFSDPWPKKRHEKRRLTYKTFLEIFKDILKPNKEIHFKTDNQRLFEYSITSMSHFGMVFNYISLDLHQSDFEGNVMTEYEQRFHNLGQRIYRMEAQFKK